MKTMKSFCVVALTALAACGSPTVPGQQAQQCVNMALGGDPAPPPTYVAVRNSELPEGVAARFSNGTVEANPREVDARVQVHEAVRQWGYANGLGASPGAEYFAKADRACGLAVANRPVQFKLYYVQCATPCRKK